MADPAEKLLPRFRYGVIHPRANEKVQRGPTYQLYRLVPLDVMEIATGLGLENYTPDGVEKAIGNYWNCVDELAKEKADVVIFGGAPISAVLGRPRVVDLLRQTKEKTGVPADAPLEALICCDASPGAEDLGDRQPMGRCCERGDDPLLGRRGDQGRRYHQKKSMGRGCVCHVFGGRAKDGARRWEGGSEAETRGGCYRGARRRRHEPPRHPGLRGGIR